MNQEPYTGFNVPEEEFAENPGQRVPCVLLLDTSASMSGEPIAELNRGLQQYRDELLMHDRASWSVEIAIFRFGGEVKLVQDFVIARRFHPPQLEANGHTPMAEAIMRGIKQLEDRKSIYKKNGIPYYRPWIFLITDGEPTDGTEAWQMACDAVRLGEQQNRFLLFAVGTGSANYERLRELSPSRPPLRLKGIAFREMFRWLSNSQARVSMSQAGARIALPPATGEGGWAEVPT